MNAVAPKVRLDYQMVPHYRNRDASPLSVRAAKPAAMEDHGVHLHIIHISALIQLFAGNEMLHSEIMLP